VHHIKHCLVRAREGKGGWSGEARGEKKDGVVKQGRDREDGVVKQGREGEDGVVKQGREGEDGVVKRCGLFPTPTRPTMPLGRPIQSLGKPPKFMAGTYRLKH